MPVDLLQSLTDAQREAVQHVDGPLLVLAGPGSGKTRVITHRIALLVSGAVASHQILALTFTNKAADEMRLRLDRLVPGHSVWLGTFHRFCAQLLRRNAELAGLDSNFSIYDASDSKKALKAVLRTAELESTFGTPAAIASGISWAKNNLMTPDTYKPRRGSALGETVQIAYRRYQQALREANAVDFDDLLLHVAVMLRENSELRSKLDRRHEYILVDEYQDTNLAQYAIVRAMSIDQQNLMVTGDPDQSIYGWRGANIANILDFERDYPEVHVVRLEENYRSTQRILHVADELICHNRKRKEKKLFTSNDLGERVRLVTYSDQSEEANAIAQSISEAISTDERNANDFAIFYRVNALSRRLETALQHWGVPYQVVQGHEFFQRKEVKDLIAYLQLINNPRNAVAFERVVNTPARGIGKTTIERLRLHAQKQNLSYLEAASQAGQVEKLTKRVVKPVADFAKMIDEHSRRASEPVADLLQSVVAQSGYLKALVESESAQEQDRADNVEELIIAAQEFDETHPQAGALEAFLQQTALVSDVDAWEGESDRVTLMTLHAAKGLEFPAVFIVAVEQGLLPHARSSEDMDKVEEERRLLFVGITRAEEELQLSLVTRRLFRGNTNTAIPSPFLMELPRSEMQCIDPEPMWESEEDRFEVEELEDASPPVDLPDEMNKSERTTPALMTAAQLLGEDPEESFSPDALEPHAVVAGMVVDHPQYGLGKVVALEGAGPKKQATVRFFGGEGTRTFRLQYVKLRPVKSPK